MRPRGADAQVEVLFEGYAGDRTACTTVLVRDGDATIVWDPGMVPSREAILGPLRERGVAPDDVTDVLLSHHHPDHTLHAGLFPAARVHDHWAWYRGDQWVDRPCDGFQVSPSVKLMHTPGHTRECLTVLVGTADGLAALTHLWWFEAGPEEDPYAVDPAALHASRERVLQVADLIVPGHGAAFRPTERTPR